MNKRVPSSKPRLTAYVSAELKNKFEAACSAAGISASEMLIELVEGFIHAQESGERLTIRFPKEFQEGMRAEARKQFRSMEDQISMVAIEWLQDKDE